MKKISLPKPKKKTASDKPHGRITNETVAEHRERVLAEGRRFKYPMQYARHKLVINAVLISAAAVILLLVAGWWQLYQAQSTSTFMYRVTELVPVPVARIDGDMVRYSDYLLYYRPSEHYLNNYDEIDPDSQDGKLQLEFKKRDAMDRAIADAYARRVADEQGLTVTDEDIDEALEALKEADNGTLSDEAIRSSAQQVFGMTPSDTRNQYRNSILRGKAAFAIDDRAASLTQQIEKKIADKKSLKTIAQELNNENENTVSYGTSGLVSRSAVFSGVRVSQIAKSEKNAILGPLKSLTSDGYLFYRVTSDNGRQINFEFLQVPLTVFSSQIAELKEADKVREYITIDPEQYQSE